VFSLPSSSPHHHAPRFAIHLVERFFGPYPEKQLQCINPSAIAFVTNLCRTHGYTLQCHDRTGICDKLPVLILVRILQLLPDTPEGVAIAEAICSGAYSIGMKRVCMNVFVRRERVPAGQFAIKKFSLCYPANIDKTDGDARYGHQWPLLDGVSWRTAVFQGGTLCHARGMLVAFERALTPALRKVVEVDHYEDVVCLKKQKSHWDWKAVREVATKIQVASAVAGIDFVLSYDPRQATRGVTAFAEELGLVQEA